MEYVAHLSKDKKLKKLVESAEPHQLKKKKEYLLLSLCFYNEPATQYQSSYSDT